jgi:hypothetical protein
MSHDDLDNIFDKDDVMDYLMYKECEKEVRKQQGGGDRGGCVGSLLLLAAPVGLFVAFCEMFFKS